MSALDTGSLNLACADALVAGLAAAGLRHAVLAPGARSSPLAAAFLRRPEISCEVITDERVAGFFALGIGRTGGAPAAVVCTSGTAAANLLPAIMEANLAGVPLLALTADRPAEAHGWGANQTADQTRLYGSHVRASHALPVPDGALATSWLATLALRLVEECRGPLPGPVHANLPFREPLLPAAIGVPPALTFVPAVETAGEAPFDAAALAARLSGRRGVVVCGEAPYPAGFAALLARAAAALDAPVLAEPLASLRFGGHDRARILARQAAFLRRPAGLEPDWVLRFGAFPVSRTLEAWLANLADAEQILVAPDGRWPDPLKRTNRWLRASPTAVLRGLLASPLAAAPAGWLERWHAAEAQAARGLDAACAGSFFEGTVVRALLAALPANGRCFVGNSLAIRAFDLFSGCGEQALVCHGNRGASGIDGNIATAAGIAAATGAPTAALIGDQAALHDGGGLAALAGRNVVVVVMDNGGGGIFDHLPLAATLPAELFARAWTTPPRLDFAALAAAHGLGYRTAADADALAAALREAFAAGGPWLVRAAIDRAASRAAFAAAVSEA